MGDADLLLAARLARASGNIHPMDWVKVYEDHTPYEWWMQKLLAIADPWGDERSDLRAATNSMIHVSGDVDREKTFENLRHYLASNQEPERVIGPDEMRMRDGEA